MAAFPGAGVKAQERAWDAVYRALVSEKTDNGSIRGLLSLA